MRPSPNRQWRPGSQTSATSPLMQSAPMRRAVGSQVRWVVAVRDCRLRGRRPTPQVRESCRWLHSYGQLPSRELSLRSRWIIALTEVVPRPHAGQPAPLHAGAATRRGAARLRWSRLGAPVYTRADQGGGRGGRIGSRDSAGTAGRCRCIRALVESVSRASAAGRDRTPARNGRRGVARHRHAAVAGFTAPGPSDGSPACPWQSSLPPSSCRRRRSRIVRSEPSPG